MEAVLKSLHVYPVKSFGGITLDSANVKSSGIPFDRYWMLVDEENHFVTQRKHPEMALFKVSGNGSGFIISFDGEELELPMTASGEVINTEVWGEAAAGAEVSDEVSQWLSERMGRKMKLLKNTKLRTVPNTESEIPFSDSSPYLLIGTGSLNLLNTKLDKPVLINRFRPNLVIDGIEPHEEDSWSRIKIGNCTFRFYKSCPRCKLPNVNQEEGNVDQQVLKMLGSYRKAENGQINFGIHIIPENEGILKKGDKVIVL